MYFSNGWIQNICERYHKGNIRQPNYLLYKLVYMGVAGAVFSFFLFYRCKKEIVSNCILALGMVLFIGIGSYLQIGSRWYGSILCFLMGIVYSQKQEKLNEWMKQKFWKN